MRPLRTVWALLEERGALALLDDPLLEQATAEIVATGVARHEVQRRIKVWAVGLVRVCVGWEGWEGWEGRGRMGAAAAAAAAAWEGNGRGAMCALGSGAREALTQRAPFPPPPPLLALQAKERAREALSRRYGRGGRLGEEEVLLCLYSISDNNSYLLFNRDPIDRRAGRAGAGRGTTHTHPPLACCAG